MGRFCFLIVLSLFVAINLQAQNVKVTEEPVITKMMDRFAELNKSKIRVEGWRVQILATTDRIKLENEKQTFQYRYPNIPINWIHNKPYYLLRAGAFSTKLEALHLKYNLERDYSGIYLVKDDSIQPQELIGF